MAMTIDEFITWAIGKAIDYDGTAGVQCVDLIKSYLNKVYNIKPQAWGNAHAYYDNFYSISPLTKNFDRIANTPTFVPQKGDICVWGTSLNGNYGHIAIAIGQGNTRTFESIDQNWTGKHDRTTIITHNYNHFLGVLRPKKTAVAVYTTGNYKLTANVKVRIKPSTNYRMKYRSELTADGQKHSMDNTYAILKKGTIVTVKDVYYESSADRVWGEIPSGFICLQNVTDVYAVKV